MVESIAKLINTPYFWGFITYIVGQGVTLWKNKKTAELASQKTDDKLSEIDARQSIEIQELKKNQNEFNESISELRDDKSHDKFAKNLNVKLTTESYSYIASFSELDKHVSQFLLQGANNAIQIFEKILYSGFENYSKEVVLAQFEIASNTISSKFKSESFPIEKSVLFSVIDRERSSFIFELDTLMRSGKVNGVRRGEFEKICSTMIKNIIKDITSLNGAKTNN